jgi:CDP-diacylglycerol--inositol 3-phosphatidyltransferase
MALKQFINVVQLVKASQKLANEDKKARREKGLPRKSKRI